MYIDREKTIFLKGIAIVLMVIHHTFRFGLEIYPMELKEIIPLFAGFCVVPLFAFFTGYSYFYHKDKSYKYSIKK